MAPRYRRTEEYVATRETIGPENSPIYIKNCKKYIKVSSGNENRYLILRDLDGKANVQCKSMNQPEWDRIVDKTKLPTMAERQKLADEYLSKKNEKQAEVNERRQEMIVIQQQSEKMRKPSLLELEAINKRRYILERAHQVKFDQEESMKEFNKMVAMKKCIATWDLQVLEREKVQSDRRNEKREQEKELKEQLKLAFKRDEMERKQEHEKRLNFIGALGEQIKEREIAVKVENEKKQLARRRFNKATKQMENDELDELKMKEKDNEKLREDQKRVNVLLQRLQAIEKEEDRVFFEKQRKAQEKTQAVAENREAILREQELKRKKELELAAEQKMRAEEQAKFRDLMEEILRMDNVERTWRQKELMEQKDKQKGLDEMYSQLAHQVKGCRMGKAQVIEDERRETCKIAKDNIDDETKDRQREMKIKLANEKQRLEILMQINNIERKKMEEREDKRMESHYYMIQDDRRQEETRRAMLARLEEVRKDGLPHNYVRDIEEFINDKYADKNDDKKKKKP